MGSPPANDAYLVAGQAKISGCLRSWVSDCWNLKRKGSIVAGVFVRVRRTLLTKDIERKFVAGKSFEAVRSLEKLSGFGDPSVLYRLGDCYERGLGTLQNFPKALQWYEAAAHLDSIDAMTKLGEFYLLGRSCHATVTSQAATTDRWLSRFAVSRDVVKATYWNRRAAKAGSARSQAMLGFQYASGTGVATDFTEARKWFSDSAAQGDASAQLGLGSLLATGELGNDAKIEAVYWLEKAAEKGDATAAWTLSQILLTGRNQIIEYSTVMKLLNVSATFGNGAAMFQLGEIYRLGQATARDLSLAETWLQRACSRRHVPAFFALANLFSEQFSPPDYIRAAATLRLGAELDDARCQVALGELLGNPRGGILDLEESGKWLRSAALKGYNSFRAYLGKSSCALNVDNYLNKATLIHLEWSTASRPVNGADP